MTIEEIYQVYQGSGRVTTDSRHITPGCLFFAMRGEHFDGNQFAEQALEAGAALCIVDLDAATNNPRCIHVESPLRTLQALATLHRQNLRCPIVGITGTNGKTTTKELVTAVLRRRYRTVCTEGNFNNHLGVPLTLLGIGPTAEMGVVEMGANHPGEIADLCAISQPDCGLITNVGRAHLEGFGDFEGVVRTKTELYRHLASKRGGLIFVNADDKRLCSEAEKLATVPTESWSIPAYAPGIATIPTEGEAELGLGIYTYGTAAGCDVRGSHVGDTPFMKFYFEVGDNVYTVQTHLLGAYNFANCMAAVAVGLYFGVEPFDIKEAIEQYVPRNHRSEWKSTQANTLYLDCYNANPSSMAAAIASFSAMQAEPKWAIIGGMHELGKAEAAEHRKLVEQLAACNLEQCLLVGSEFEGIVLPSNMLRFSTTEAVAEWLSQHRPTGCTLLVKGSNTNRLWTLEGLL